MARSSSERRGKGPSPGAAARARAARILNQVRTHGRSLTDALAAEPPLGADDDPRDAGLVQEMCYGSLRLLPRLEALTGLMLERPLNDNVGDLQALLLIGLYQLREMRVPPHAAVAATVDATRELDKAWARGLVNAVLRRYQREHAKLEQQCEQSDDARYLFPSWLLNRLRNAWPYEWKRVVEASNARPPMALRVNAIRADRSGYATTLADKGMAARPLRELSAALVLDAPVATAKLPGFAQGLVSVQDSGAQLAATLLGAKPGERVLDACAAPGGKSAHILELEPNAVLTAVDLDAERLQSVATTLERLGLRATLVAGDLEHPDPAWAEPVYDRILLDAPCSATGVIRRHPDIKHLRRDSDIAKLVRRQAAMLDSAWSLLRPGGTLLYATCSVLPQENAEQVAAFLERTPDAAEDPFDIAWGRATAPGRQLLPGVDPCDGFYYARLRKDPP